MIYRTYRQLAKDLDKLKDTTIFIIEDFEHSLVNLDSYEYRSLMKKIKDQNIKFRKVKEKNKKGVKSRL